MTSLPRFPADRRSSGDPPSAGELEAWIVASSPRALGYALTLLHDRHEAEDIVHDCYSRLLAKQAKYNLPRDGTKLLFRSITNACINHSQRHRRQQSLHVLEQVGGEDSQALADSPMKGPVQGAIEQELAMAVAEAMQELPVVQRAAIELRSFGHTLGEVAEMLAVSHGHARVLLHRARAALAAKLNAYLED